MPIRLARFAEPGLSEEIMNVELYLIRHADALPVGQRGIDEDSARPLSAKGEKQADQLGRFFKARGIKLDQLVASPYLRARQTAELMLPHLPQPKPALTESDGLLPGARPRKLAKHLRSLQGERIGLVGHLPHIADWAGWLIGGKKAQIDFAKAGVACILGGEMPAKGLGTLQWLITPEWFE
jgi:phosphohistidine phosphatase